MRPAYACHEADRGLSATPITRARSPPRSLGLARVW
ncbi:hypothetical protein Mnod_4851 [Methylobacterium nodulans ORS 2060]|uniref:Uncharacterized protein n=1 Tax=Methylobacterium nodulans (strain LMG 21967 / CNCM I-2342 / ORS 2060) TaxID=460265 RepID=B8IG03_METNO|nr:hypothetical protein Mnod_4851 [Methylobacterium nodulans ORS 2060]